MLGGWRREGRLTSAQGGLMQICKKFKTTVLSARQRTTPAEIVALLTWSIERNLLQATLPSKYNAFQLIEWTLQTSKEIFYRIINNDEDNEHAWNLIITIMRSKQALLIKDILKSHELTLLQEWNEFEHQNKQINHRKQDKNLLNLENQQTRKNIIYILKERQSQIKNELALVQRQTVPILQRFISRNYIEKTNAIISNIKPFILQEEDISHNLITDINIIFANLLLNLRRCIRGCSDKFLTQQQLRLLKLLQIQLYYLSAIILPTASGFIRTLSNDIFHHMRSLTFIYFMHNARGLTQLVYYFNQAPLNDLQQDMDIISVIINQHWQ